MSGDLERFVGSPADLMEEVAIVPCGGCPKGWSLPWMLWCSGPTSAQISLPSLAAQVEVSLRRLHSAHAVIALSACAEDCVSRLLAPLRAPDVILIAPELGDLASVAARLESELARLCDEPRAVLTGQVIHLDCRSMRCPLPIAKLTRALASLGPGEGVEVTADDPSFRPDLEAWCRQTGNLLEAVHTDGALTVALVRQRPRQEDLDQPAGTDVETAEAILDCRGMRCPMPIVKLGQKARTLGEGTLVVLADDPAFPLDVRAWCDQTQAVLLSLEGDVDGTVRASVRLPKRATASGAPVEEPAPSQADDLPMLGHLDQRALRSPMHIVQLGEFARTHSGPGLVEIVTRDSAIETDLRNWCARTGGALVGLSRDGQDITAVVAVNLVGAAPSADEQPPEPPKEATPPKPPRKAPSAAQPSPGERTTLDCRGLRCPLPILRLNELAKTLTAGTIEIIADDAAFPADLEAWCQRMGTQIEFIDRQGRQTTALLTVGSAAPAESTEPHPEPTDLVASPTERTSAPVESLDCRGLRCPMPIVKLNEMAKSRDAFAVEVLADDPAFPADVEAWCQQSGVELVSLEPDGTGHRAMIQRVGRAAPPPASPPRRPSTSPPRRPSASPPRRPPASQSRRPPPPPKQVGQTSPRSRGGVAQPSRPDARLDCRGLKCPMPIFRLNKEVTGSNVEVIDVLADDPAFPADLKAWCQAKGFELVKTEERPEGFLARLRRRAEKNSGPEIKRTR